MEGKPFGRYQLIELLGSGAMGRVWRAFDTATRRVVAIKVLPAQLGADPTFAERFRREAHAAAQLDEPHVVPIHTFGEIDGWLYLDMRLIKGEDLEHVLARGPMDSLRAVKIIEQIASALNAAHRAGLIHRDVKPSNIVLAEDDFAYLIDFGIARAAGDTQLTGTGNVIGTWAYMAPEQFSSGRADVRSDIYALTCVLYECLTASKPFPGDSVEQQIAAHLTTPPPQPSLTKPGISPQLDAVISVGMAKDPDQRYATTTELSRAACSAISAPSSTPQPATDHQRSAAAAAALAPTQVGTPEHIAQAQAPTKARPVDVSASISPRQLLVDEVTALYRSEKWQEVVAKADELARLDPGDPDPGGMVTDARARLRQADLEHRYAVGVELLQRAQWREAIRAFTAIEQEHRGYRDTSALISAAEKLDEKTGSHQEPAPEPPPSPDSPSLITALRGPRRASMPVVVGVAGVLALVAAVAIFVGMQDSNSSKTASSVSSESTTLVEAPLPATIDEYIKANNIQATTVTPSTPGAPRIDLPVPPGWTRMPEGSGDNYFGVVFDTPTNPEDAPRFIVTVEKLLGDVDTEKVLALAAGSAEELPGYAGDPPVRAPLSGFPGARLAGTYMKNDVPRMVMRYVVVIPAADGRYLMRISVDSPEADTDAVEAAAKVFTQKTTITV